MDVAFQHVQIPLNHASYTIADLILVRRRTKDTRSTLKDLKQQCIALSATVSLHFTLL